MLIKTGDRGYIPVQDILTPKNLLTCLTDKHIGNVFLALVETQLVADTHGQSAIPQQTGVIGLGHAINLSEDKALEGGDRDVGGERLEGRRPVSLEENGVLVGSRLDGIRHTIWRLWQLWLSFRRFTYSRGQGSDSKNQIQLRQVARTRLQRFHAIQILFVGFENGRTMDNWIKRSPFLEENVDELIGHKSRRRLNGLIGTIVGNGRRGLC